MDPISNQDLCFILRPCYLICMVWYVVCENGELIYVTDITVHWIFAPPHHGKRACDSHGAVVKSGIRMYLLNGMILLFKL